MPLVSDFAEIGGAGPILAAQAQTLNHAGKTEQHGRCDPDCPVCGQDRDHQRPEAHEQHGKHQCVAPAVVIAQVAEQPATNRAHEETDREEDGGVQLLDDGIAAGEERRGEVQRERGIGIEIVPFDQVADRSDEDRPHPAADIGQICTIIAVDHGGDGGRLAFVGVAHESDSISACQP